MKSLYTLFAGTLATGLMMTGLAHGQQSGQQQDQQTQLSNRDARQYMQRLERDINQMVQSGNMSRLRQWTQNNVADNAVFSGTRQINSGGRSTAFVAVTLTKQDLMRMQRFALATDSEMDQMAHDFNLSIQVNNVQPVGDGAALVKSRITQTRTIGPMSMNQQSGNEGFSGRQFSRNQQFSNQQFTEGAGSSQGQQGQQRLAQQGGMEIETQALCTHLLERNQNSGNIQILMGVCDAETQTQ